MVFGWLEHARETDAAILARSALPFACFASFLPRRRKQEGNGPRKRRTNGWMRTIRLDDLLLIDENLSVDENCQMDVFQVSIIHLEILFMQHCKASLLDEVP